MVDLAGAKRILENVIAFVERPFNITALLDRSMDDIGPWDRVPRGKIRRPGRAIFQIFMHQRRSFADRFLGIKHGGQLFVIHLDQTNASSAISSFTAATAATASPA